MSRFFRRPKLPRFSVVMPTYNRSRFIGPTIESVLAQTHQAHEIIVVGDGCDDDTGAFLRQKFSREVRWVNLPQRTGSQSGPNNTGIATATGTHIAYLGHDDIWSPSHLRALAQVLADDEVDVAVSGCIFYGPPSSKYYEFTGLFDESAAGAREFFPPSSIAHSRELTNRIGSWRPCSEIKPPVDCEFLMRAAAHGCFFKSSGAFTVHKFAAGHRYLSYRWPDCEEQDEMLLQLRAFNGEARALAHVTSDCANGARMIPRIPYPDFGAYAPGEFSGCNAEAKGLRDFAIEPLTSVRTFIVNDSPAALDWFPLERDQTGVLIRWSGPNPNPRYFLPISCDRPLQLRLRVARFAHDSLANLLALEVNDEPTALAVAQSEDSHFVFVGRCAAKARNGLKLQLRLPRNEWLHKLSPPRYAGLALHAIEVEPLAEFTSDTE